MLKLTTDGRNLPQENDFPLDELAREGARKMIAAALDLEVAEYVTGLKHQKDELGHALVVRNGRAATRKLTVGCGTIEIDAPRVNDKRDGHRFVSSILPPYMRRSPKVTEVLPILYLKGLSSGSFSTALESLLGSGASGLSASAIIRLKSKWHDEYIQWRRRDLSQERYAYVWADGVNLRIRLGDDDKLCLLAMIGVRTDGSKELLAVEDGYRESKESWASVLRSLKRRGMAAPLLAIGDGGLGFWAAAGDVWPTTKEQRCWVHKIANVLDKLPKRLQGKAKSMLHDIMNAETKADALAETKIFVDEHEAKYPKAVTCLTKDIDQLTAFFDFPAQHWQHLRTTNPIESPFSTVKLRTKVTKGAGSREAALSMGYKLLESAQDRWHKINSAHLTVKVLEGVVFKDGIKQESEPERVVA